MNIKTNKMGLTLMKWHLDYAESYAKYADNVNIWNNFRDEFPSPYKLSDAIKFIQSVSGAENKTHFAIVYHDECIGGINIYIHNDIKRYNGVIGYWMAEPFWNKGLMTEAVKVFTAYAFNVLGLVRVYVKIFATNTGSIRVVEKLGYKKEGHFVNALVKNGEFIDQVLYAVNKPENMKSVSKD